jgi:hypothetical protein
MDETIPFPVSARVLPVFNYLFPAIYHTIISQRIAVSSPWRSQQSFPGNENMGKVDFNRL